jgi:hypothetical protein
MRFRELIWAVGLAVVVTALVPAAAGAVKLGTPHFTYDDADAGVGCGAGANCIAMQRRLPDATLKAPFSGTIRKWRVAVSSPQLRQLMVLRKQEGGSYKVVRASDAESPPGAGAYTYGTKLRVRRGDRVGLYASGSSGANVTMRNTPDATRVTFSPPPIIGGSGTPGAPLDGELLYSATLKR